MFSVELIPELLAVEGDQGGRDVLRRHRSGIRFIDFGDLLAGEDVDTPEDLHRLRRALGTAPSDGALPAIGTDFQQEPR